jgi:hypothetical protein
MALDETWKRQAQWGEFLAFSCRMEKIEFRSRALEFARAVMKRARINVEAIVASLRQTGYRFLHPEMAHEPPRDDVGELVERLKAKGVHLPLALHAWYAEVGGVNLMGSHPSWKYTGYLFPGQEPQDAWFTEPLVVDGLNGLEKEVENCAYNKERIGPNYLDFIGPFRIPIAPDDLNKANFSGGTPYELACDRPAVDSIVFNERHSVSFMAYLRIAFEWEVFQDLSATLMHRTSSLPT